VGGECRREGSFGDRLGKDRRWSKGRGTEWMRMDIKSSWVGEQWIVAQENEGK
jgi:hypothetical protein